MRTSPAEIQAKAMELFLKKGYHGTSTTDICNALGISRPTLYWYFEDKEALLFALHRERIEGRFREVVDAVKAQSDPLARLRTFVREYTALICGDPHNKVLIKETEYMAPEHVEWVTGQWGELLEVLREAIRELKADGRAKDVAETFAAFGLIGMITWAYTWFDFSRPEGIAGLTGTVEELFLSGLLKSGVDWR